MISNQAIQTFLLCALAGTHCVNMAAADGLRGTVALPSAVAPGNDEFPNDSPDRMLYDDSWAYGTKIWDKCVWGSNSCDNGLSCALLSVADTIQVGQAMGGTCWGGCTRVSNPEHVAVCCPSTGQYGFLCDRDVVGTNNKQVGELCNDHTDCEGNRACALWSYFDRPENEDALRLKRCCSGKQSDVYCYDMPQGTSCHMDFFCKSGKCNKGTYDRIGTCA